MKHLLLALLMLVVAFQTAAAQPDHVVSERRGNILTERSVRRQVRFAPMSDENFAILTRIVKKTSFDENKTDILRVACMGNRFTCEQCASLLSHFSFDDKRLVALKILVPCLVNKENLSGIIKKFTFSSGKDKALELLSEPENKKRKL